jgi:hypothetical protein
MPGRSVSSACLLRQVSHGSRVRVLAIAAQIPSKKIGSGYFQETHPDRLFEQCSHYRELVSDPEQMPRVLEIGIQTAISRRGVSVIAHTMRSTRFWRDSGLSFERTAVGSWIAVGAAEEVVAT